MSRRISVLILLAALVLPLAGRAVDRPLSRSEQIIVVVTKNWDVVDGALQRFKRDDSGWLPVGETIPVVVGRNGLGRGRGLHSKDMHDGPQKKEGDGKAPAGVFRLQSAFGYAPAEKMKAIKLPYVQCTTTLECVDDSASKRYNTIVDRPKVVEPDWKSSEKMLMDDDEYRLGIVVSHNDNPALPESGSCIFMHIWKAPGQGTSGCTAMTAADVGKLLHWLDPAANPLLVQLPESEYLRLQKDWELPNMPVEKTPKQKN